jgi:hypothetical protein
MRVFTASLGGIFSLFLGCSFMSGVEVLYYFTLRLFMRLRKEHVEQSMQIKRHPEVITVGQTHPQRNVARVVPMPDYAAATRCFS